MHSVQKENQIDHLLSLRKMMIMGWWRKVGEADRVRTLRSPLCRHRRDFRSLEKDLVDIVTSVSCVCPLIQLIVDCSSCYVDHYTDRYATIVGIVDMIGRLKRGSICKEQVSEKYLQSY